MKQRLFKISILLLILISCKKEENNDVLYLEPNGRRLREIVAEKFSDTSFMVGATCGLWAFDYDATSKIVATEFGYVTSENEFKQLTIHPNNDIWNYTNATKWIEKAELNSQIVRIHCPIGPQVSEWTKNDSRTKDELEKNLTDFVTSVCTTFNKNPRVKYMDVVNETIKDGEWFGPLLGSSQWENPWTLLGFDIDKNQTPLYIKKAFELSNTYSPQIKQLYNHHEGPENTASWLKIKETILYLRAKGLRVDAIGWQAHVANGWATEENLTALSNLIDWAQQNKLEFHITEASSFIKNKLSAKELDLQAETYSKIIEIVMNKSKTGKVGWNTWHLTDAYTYKSEYYPSLFDENCKPKPSYYAIQNLLENN